MPNPRLTCCTLTLALALVVNQPARAQSASEPHSHNSTDIIVTAPFVRELDLLAGRSVLTGPRLLQDVRSQIGDTLVRQPGVSATSFTPGASRPVLRGFQGERVRVLTDGLGSLDVSNTSADHAVTIDPLTAERIEVLHGPAVLLFGSQAVGGAVNVIDRRIPRAVPGNGAHVDAIAAYGSAAGERGGGAAFDLALSPHIVIHADGNYRKANDLRIGGFVLTPDLRAEQRSIAAEELMEGHADEAAEALELAEKRGRLPNSATRTYTAGGGVALIKEGGNLGFSIGYYNSRYGVPERPGGGHHHEEGEEAAGAGEEHGEVTIGMKQFRADVRGEVAVGGDFLDKIRVRAGYADYEHTEFEGVAVGTVFNSNAYEGRIELVQADRSGWRGAIGLQGFTRDFAAVGEEAFVPPNVTDQFGLFTVQEFELGKAGVEVAGRYEHTRVRSNAVRVGLDETTPLVAIGRNFNNFSAAFGLNYETFPGVKIGINASRTSRAPSAEELFSNGPHVATQAFEIGDSNFKSERSWGIELYARGSAGPTRFQISGYASWFDNYIYEIETGLEQDELPVFAYRQARARYYGVEAEITATLLKRTEFELEGNLVADYVNARLGNNGGPIPRIPPFRVLAGLTASSGDFGGRVEVEHAAPQKRVAAFENRTDDFTLVNASVSWHPFGRKQETVLILSANNIFDADARRHASFTKSFVPLAGRDIRISARIGF